MHFRLYFITHNNTTSTFILKHEISYLLRYYLHSQMHLCFRNMMILHVFIRGHKQKGLPPNAYRI